MERYLFQRLIGAIFGLKRAVVSGFLLAVTISLTAMLPPAVAEDAAASTSPYDFSAPKKLEGDKVSKGFFANGSARNVFAEAPQQNDAPAIEYFPVTRLIPKADLEERKNEDLEQQQAEVLLAEKRLELESTNSAVNSAVKTAPKSRAEIVKTFGNPGAEAPILGEEKAPTPFKGMMAALESKDEELAYQYARQYVRHLRNLKERTTRVMGLTGLAMEKEGMLEKGSWQAGTQYQEERARVAPFLKAEEGAEEELDSDMPQMEITAVDSDVTQGSLSHTALGQSGLQAQNSGGKIAPNTNLLKMDKEKARLLLRSKGLPSDPSSNLAVYFIFRLTDSDSVAMAPQFEALYQRYKNNPRLNFLGLTFETEAPSQILGFKKRLSLTFPIASGVRMVEALKLRKAPATVVMIEKTGQAVRESGVRSADYLDELVKTIAGGRV